jgi:hypothetical protein
MTARNKWIVLGLFALGLGLRLLWLPLWGTFDTEVQKAWSARAASVGLADIYGPPDSEVLDAARSRGGSTLRALLTTPFPRTRFTWWGTEYFVDYPPGSLLVLAAAGKLYGLVDPELPNRRAFNGAINVAPLLGSLVIAVLLLRSAPGVTGAWRALAFWMNPAILLAAPILGYQDTIFGALGLAAVLALLDRRYALATALVVAAGLVKPQGALLVPTLVAIVLREGRPAAWLKAAGAGALTAILVFVPWWSQGYLLSALDGCRRPLTQVTLAPLGLNVWWIAGYVMDWERRGPWPTARIVRIGEFAAWAGWDPRLPSRILLLAAIAANLWLLLRRLDDAELRRLFIPLSVILQVHAYALFATSVHENHTLLAVVLAPLLLGIWRKGGAVVAATSAFCFASLFLAAGLGRKVTRLATIEALRLATVLDFSVIVAIGHVVLVAFLFAWAARCKIGPR